MDKKFTNSPISISTLTSLKIWFTLYGIYLISYDTLHFNGILISLFAIIGLAFTFLSFRIRPASQQNVTAFFGNSIQIQHSPAPEDLNATGHGPPLAIIGHRGAGLDAPENSLSAIQLCKAKGCLAIEFDLSITKDSVPIVFHDDNLMRMTGIDREVKDTTWDELQRVDISVLHPTGETFKNERIPSLEQVIDLCLELGVKFIIDLKDDNTKILKAVVAAFQQKPEMYSMGVVSSFYAKVIFDVRRQDPNIIGCMAWRPGYFRYRRWNATWNDLEVYNKSIWRDSLANLCDCLNDWALNNLYWWFLGLSCTLVNKDAMSRSEIFQWRNQGIRVFVAVVNSASEKLNFLNNIGVGYLTDTLNNDHEFLTSSRKN